MNLSLPELISWLEATPIGDHEQVVINDVSVDSRQLMGPNTLFVALAGPHFDGHQFVEAAFEAGAAAALVSRQWGEEYGGEKPLIAVDDTLRALQAFAGAWRARFNIPVVGITGSNGKTIVKDMLAAILGRQMTIYKSPGSYNSQVGVALAMLGIRQEHELAIIEAGISQVGEMEYLQEMIRPTDGILTNIGLAHVAGLGDRDTTAREKRKLFDRLTGAVVVPADEPRLSSEMFHVKRIAVGAPNDPDGPGPDCDLAICDVEELEQGFRFFLCWSAGRQIPVSLAVPGRHNIENAAAAAAMAAHLGADDRAIAEGLATYSLAEMRLEMHTTSADITLINDTYNADPTSVRAALSVMDRYAGRQRRVAILGDMLDLGSRGPSAHHQIGAHVARHRLDKLFCVGDLARHIADGARASGMDDERVECVDDLESLHGRLESWLEPGDVVLFKASRGIGLERAARRLIESVAPTRQYIDLEAIGENFHTLRRHVGQDVKVMAVVKSFGYGNDATRISQTLVREGVDALAVAFPDEAIPLRKRGIKVPILVTNARAEEADKFVKYDLQPLIYNEKVAAALARQCRRRGTNLGVHLAVDTGMRRAGLRAEEVGDFVDKLSSWPSLYVAGVMTHFAAADIPEEDDFTGRQIQLFNDVVQTLKKRGVEPPLVHAANTAAAWRFPQARFDMVRIGLGLYGFSPSKAVGESMDPQVRPALRFTTRILHIHDVEPGESVGYGRTWRADQPRTIATLAAGYNDGFPYFLSNRGQVLINGRRCPVVGSVCMDVTVVDITDAGDVDVGDEAVLFGRQGDAEIHIDEWAEIGGTINYELLCNISPRVRRIFLR